MKKYIFLSILCAVVCACGMDNVYTANEKILENNTIGKVQYEKACACFSTRGYKGGLTMPFTDLSVGSRIVYDFGDGTTKVFNPGKTQKLLKGERQFTHTYNKKKTYTVTITAYGLGGDTDKASEKLELR